MADSITRLQEKVQSYKASLSRLRERTESTAARAQRLAASAAGAYVYGKMEANATRTGQQMATVFDLDPMLTWGIGAAFASDYVGGRMGELLGDAGTGIVSAYAYKQATT